MSIFWHVLKRKMQPKQNRYFDREFDKQKKIQCMLQKLTSEIVNTTKE